MKEKSVRHFATSQHAKHKTSRRSFSCPVTSKISLSCPYEAGLERAADHCATVPKMHITVTHQLLVSITLSPGFYLILRGEIFTDSLDALGYILCKCSGSMKSPSSSWPVLTCLPLPIMWSPHCLGYWENWGPFSWLLDSLIHEFKNGSNRSLKTILVEFKRQTPQL